MKARRRTQFATDLNVLHDLKDAHAVLLHIVIVYYFKTC